MIELKFNTAEHTLEFTYRDVTKTYSNVVTIKTHGDYYEVLQRQNSTDKNAPLFRTPINSTIIEFIHQ